MTRLPRRSERLTCSPVSELSVKSGAGSPGASRSVMGPTLGPVRNFRSVSAVRAAMTANARWTEGQLRPRYGVLLPHLDERSRRLVLGADAQTIGHGGIAAVA